MFRSSSRRSWDRVARSRAAAFARQVASTRRHFSGVDLAILTFGPASVLVALSGTSRHSDRRSVTAVALAVAQPWRRDGWWSSCS